MTNCNWCGDEMKSHPFCKIPVQHPDYVCECEIN